MKSPAQDTGSEIHPELGMYVQLTPRGEGFQVRYLVSRENAVGKDIYIRAGYTFNTALALFVPGKGSVAFGSSAGAGTFDFPGYSHQIDSLPKNTNRKRPPDFRDLPRLNRWRVPASYGAAPRRSHTNSPEDPI
jgi:hypothetical protein